MITYSEAGSQPHLKLNSSFSYQNEHGKELV